MDKHFPLEEQILELAAGLDGRAIVAADPDYDDLRRVALGNFDARPLAIIRVAHAGDAATVVSFAQAAELPLAVRSGGHSTMGHSSCDGGIVIDLRDINGMDLDLETQTLWAGAGLTAGEVTRMLEPHGVIVGFGDNGGVGIGGLTLGGGMGYLVRKHGLTMDSLLAVEIVTADGTVRIADAEHHPDLFWALRGGGGNFGIVTRFKFRVHPLPHFVGGPLILPAFPEVLAGFAAAAQAAPETLSAIGLVMPLPPLPFVPAELHGQIALVAMVAYAGEPEGAEAALAPFRALAEPIADLVRPSAYSSLYDLDPPPDMRPAVAMRSRFVTRFGLAEAKAMLSAMHACDAPMKMGQIRVLGGAYSRVGAEDTAFAHRDGEIMCAFLAMYGGGPEVAARQELWADYAMSTLTSKDSPAYVNFLSAEGDRGLAAAYPARTLARLRDVKRRYDPENLFRLNQNISPA